MEENDGGTTMLHLVAADLTAESLPALALWVDCVVNSANNHLLTPGVTGIAGAILKAGGAQIQQASDMAKANYEGGTVPIGDAVWTEIAFDDEPGSSGCGVVHAVAMAYDSNGRRVKATPVSVRQAFHAALLLAHARGCRTIAAKLMCARPGYSDLSAAKADVGAPLTMLESMLAAVEDFVGSCDADGLRIIIFIPDSYGLPLTPPLPETQSNIKIECTQELELGILAQLKRNKVKAVQSTNTEKANRL